ncbi:pyridoxal-dependent decarboxylase [Pedobacter sp. UYP1]|uniref:pyridoxal phosphate-dependent decarboxylase family protein n=1 Tax=Pedobacter sp. UYP1 TaxID=1756396 RepID=UPI003393AC97
MGNNFSNINSPAVFERTGYELINLLTEELERSNLLGIGETIQWETPDEQLKYWENDFASGLIEDPISLFKKIISRSINMNRRGNIGHQIAAPYPITVLTSALMAHLNNGMGVYEVGMTGNAMEKIIIGKLAGMFGLPEDAAGFITSGGSLGNLTALLTAKSMFLQQNPEVALGSMSILVSSEAHYSIERAGKLLGIPSGNIIKVQVDASFKMKTSLLDSCLNEAKKTGRNVFCIIGSACSTSTGSFDDLVAIGNFAKSHQIWFHVDAAHGGPVIFSDLYRYLLNGIEWADSIILDFHKMMAVPSLSTALIYRHKHYSRATFSQDAKYLWRDQEREEWYNSGKQTFECTKPMSIIHVYTVLRVYGTQIYQEHIDHLYGLASQFAAMISLRDNFQLLIKPESNIVCFRYIGGTLEDNEMNRELQDRIMRDGTFYIVGTTVESNYYLRVSLMNTRTTLQDLEILLDMIVGEASQIK